MRKVILLAVVLAVIAAGWFFYFHNSDEITQVSVSKAEIMDLSNRLEFSGQVVPAHMYSVMSETGGTVKTLFVSEGDTVEIGDSLLALDASALKHQLDEAQLQYNMLKDVSAQSVMAQSGALSEAEQSLQEQKIKVALALSQTTGYDFESFNKAFAQTAQDTAAQMASSLNGLSLNDIQSAAADDGNGSEAALAALSVENLQAAIDKMSFYSLMKGTVIAVNIHEGEVLSPGVPALVIADTQTTIINGYVYEKDVEDLEEGQEVKIIMDKGICWGTVTGIGKAAGIGETSEYGSMTKVEITPGKYFTRLPGAVVDLEIAINGKQGVLAVPLDCITDDNCVYVVNAEGAAEKRSIQTGFQDMYYAEVKSGVAEGEQVILSPNGIEDGQKVAYD